MRNYAEIDIDDEQFPIADLSLDLHWIQLPTSVLLERRKAERVAWEKERAAALPENHKIILAPADPTYSPVEEELWPIINETIHRPSGPIPRFSRKWWLRSIASHSTNIAVGVTLSPPISIAPILPS